MIDDIPHVSVWDAAFDYAEAGISVFPLHHPIQRGNRLVCSCGNTECSSAAKHPMTANGLHGASAELTQVAKWEVMHPKANIGIVTGAISGVVVLDIDPRHGGDEALKALEREHGALPPTVRISTGGGGEHIFFRHPGGNVPNSAGRIGDGIDLRGDGGYVVAAPSQHISGRYYVVQGDGFHASKLADMPGWLLALSKKPIRTSSASAAEWLNLIRGVNAGGRHNALVRLAGKLFASKLDPRLVAELCLAWNDARCKPPLPFKEATAAIDGIAKLHLNQLKEGK